MQAIIYQDKEEVCPNGYQKLDVNLRKGAIGRSVYLCYTRYVCVCVLPSSPLLLIVSVSRPQNQHQTRDSRHRSAPHQIRHQSNTAASASILRLPDMLCAVCSVRHGIA
jgi:hypothetical protein